MQKSIVLSLYRTLRRLTVELSAAAVARGLSIDHEIAKLPEAFPFAPWHTEPLPVLRARFNYTRKWNPESSDATIELNRGFAALRQCERRIVQLTAEDWQPRPAALTHSVGDVVRHSRYGYRGVVYGWDSAFDASKRSMSDRVRSSLERGLDQPFYQILVHHADASVSGDGVMARQHFSSAESPKRPMLSTYVPQENLFLDDKPSDLSTEEAREWSGRVTHPDLENYFSLCIPPRDDDVAAPRRSVKYVANEALRELYPEDN